jgi:flagellar hook-associated protein 2
MSTGASSITPVTLTGVSQYSADYQAVLNQAGTVAEIPLNALTTEDTSVLAANTALGTIETAATGLFTSLQTLSTDASSQVLGATSSDPTTLTATATGATTANTYTINSVSHIASAASEDSVKSYADSATTPVSTTGTLQLTVGSQNYALTLGTNSLTGLVKAINTSGAPVTAAILTTSNGNYLSVTATATGATTLKLLDDPTTSSNPSGTNTELLTQANQGVNAEFSLNGIDVKQSSNTVNSVIPGVTLQLLQPSTSAVTVSLQSDPSQLSSDLQTFVTSYNAVEQALAANEGTNNGGLNGDPVVQQLQQTLRQITGFFTTTGTVTNLGDLGITFADSTGAATFDSTAFNALSAQNITDGFSFLTSLTTGTGNFVAQLQSFTDPISGMITTEEQGDTATDTDLKSQISTMTGQINTMLSNLQLRLAAADATEAELQSQQSTVNSSLVGLNYVLYGQNPEN